MKTTTAYHHNAIQEAPQQPDTQPGNYYVTAMDPGTHKSWSMLGPFINDHAAALAACDEVAAFCKEHEPRATWYAFGTARFAADFIRPGNCNKHLPHLLPAALAAADFIGKVATGLNPQSPDAMKIKSAIGNLIDPDLRLGDKFSLADVYVLYHKGEITAAEFTRYHNELRHQLDLGDSTFLAA